MELWAYKVIRETRVPGFSVVRFRPHNPEGSVWEWEMLVSDGSWVSIPRPTVVSTVADIDVFGVSNG